MRSQVLFGSIEDPYESAQPKKKLRIKGQRSEKEKGEKKGRTPRAKS